MIDAPAFSKDGLALAYIQGSGGALKYGHDRKRPQHNTNPMYDPIAGALTHLPDLVLTDEF
jgi:hypothetical protein